MLYNYLHTLLHLDPAILVIVHLPVDVPQGFKAEAVSLTQAWWAHHRARVCRLGQKSGGQGYTTRGSLTQQ